MTDTRAPERYSGTIVPLVTPLDAAGQVSIPSVGRLVASVRRQVTGLMPALSSGEGWKLSERQWTDMVAATVACADGLPVLAGLQVPDTAAVLDRARLAVRLGVDAIVVTAPFGAGVGQEDIWAHFRTVISTVDVPLFVYNESALSGNEIEFDTLVRICRLPGVVGVKESSGSAELTSRLAAAVPGVPVFEGWENLLTAARGIAGMVGPLANLEPELCNAVLADPSGPRQAEVNAACERFSVFQDDWYRSVKRELHRRGVVETDRTVEDTGGPS
jgi:4-hydroxy-tetrahydrodipicolinate synthase